MWAVFAMKNAAVYRCCHCHDYELCFIFEKPLTRMSVSGHLFRLDFFFVMFFFGMSGLTPHNTLKQEVATSFCLTSYPSVIQLHVSHHSLSHKLLSLKITVTYTEPTNWLRHLAYFNIFFFNVWKFIVYGNSPLGGVLWKIVYRLWRKNKCFSK